MRELNKAYMKRLYIPLMSGWWGVRVTAAQCATSCVLCCTSLSLQYFALIKLLLKTNFRLLKFASARNILHSRRLYVINKDLAHVRTCYINVSKIQEENRLDMAAGDVFDY